MDPTHHLIRSADVLLRDGTVAAIRSATPEDGPALEKLHAGLSADNLHRRFFAAGPNLASDYLHHLAASPEVLALIAARDGRLVALGTAEPVGDGTAEAAFVVADDCHGVGLGSLLLEHLAAAARDRGIQRFTAEVLSDNREMLQVLADAGFAETAHTDHGTVCLTLEIAVTDVALCAADARERAAEMASLRPLLHPDSVAVVGVRSDGTGVGAAVVRSIAQGGYAGRLCVVHPRLDKLLGAPAWPRFVDVPEPVDLAVVAVPAAAVLAAVQDAAAAGARAAVILSSGFEMLGEEGRRTQQRILEVARRSSMRVVGPNCLGIVCNGPEERLDATFGDQVPPPGGLAVASQSGGIGIALLDGAETLGLGLRYFVSLGNKIDVSSNDLLAAWTDDPQVSAAALYLESFGNPLKFARVARRFAERKPVLGIVGGRSRGGARAGASHTAAATTSAVEIDALFAQAGVLGCEDADDMVEAALLLTRQPLPAGRRVGILSNAGGMGVLAADAAERHALAVPELSGELRARLEPLLAGTAGTGNPVDAGAAVEPDAFEELAETMLASDEIDALVVVVVPTKVTDGARILHRLVRLARRPHTKPVVIVPFGSLGSGSCPPGITAYRSVESAMRALEHAAVYAAWRSYPADEPPPADHGRGWAARQRLDRELGDLEDLWLPATAVAELLGAYELAPIGVPAYGPSTAVAAAAGIGYPVAVKAAGGSVVHKSELGLVRLGLSCAEEVQAAVIGIQGRLGPEDRSVLVQPMVSGVEMALGVVRDEHFGPLVMVAAGGVDIDVWDDRAFLIPPVSRDAAHRAVRTLRIFPLLEGHRGTPRVDIAALVDLVVQTGQLAVELPDVAELDVNPVYVGEHGCTVVDVKVRAARAVPLDAGVPRRLPDRA